jgi:cell division protein FtsA
MEKTVRSINRAVEDAQMTSGAEIDSVTVGVAGEHIRSINSHGVIAISRSDNEITSAEVQRAIEAARAVAIPVDREIIHVIPQAFSVDDQSGIKDPVGMTGVRLEVEAHIVTASITTARNLYRALERCELRVDRIALESLALSRVLLTDDEIERGVVLVDIGGDLTNVSVFHEGAIRHTAVVSLGARNITNDIAIGLRTSVDKAEELKMTHGCALASMVDPEEMIEVSPVAGRPSRAISRNVLASVIEPRTEEILSLVHREMRKAGVSDLLTDGVVITGGGSLLSGTAELAEQIFGIPVRTGQIGGLEHIPDELNSNRYATALGLLAYAFEQQPGEPPIDGGARGWLKRFEKWISRHF